MIKEGKFGVQESISLISIIIVSKVFYSSPSIIARYVGTSMWYMTLISGITAAIAFTFIYLLLKQFPGRDIMEIFEIVLGKAIGLIFSGIITIGLVFYASTLLREFVDVLKVYVFSLSPMYFIIGLFMFGTVIICFLGLETIVRLAKLFVYLLFVGYLILIILSWQNYDFHRMFPILGYGLENTVIHGIMRSSVYSDVIILAVIAGSLQGANHIKKAGYTSILISTLLASISFAAYTLSFPYYTLQELTAPMYELATLIDYGRFFQRLDQVFLFVWVISSLISVTAVFYISTSIYCKMFRIQEIKPVILPFAIITIIAAIASPANSVVLRNVHYAREYGWTISFILPIITLIVAKLRKKVISSDA
jgi:spore germination protein KB